MADGKIFEVEEENIRTGFNAGMTPTDFEQRRWL
jgi:hypothetical protein